MNTPSAGARPGFPHQDQAGAGYGTATTSQIIAAADGAAGALALHCLVCGAPIIDSRRIRRGQHTCSKFCHAIYRLWRRNLIALFKCRLCGRPKRERASGRLAPQVAELDPVRSAHKAEEVGSRK
jgi:hypothetical protein